MDKPLSDSDIESKLGKCIMMYNQLENYEDIEDVLPEVGSYKVLLVRRTPNSGHWVCIFRHSNEEYFFVNSYGYAYDKQERIVLSEETNDRYNSQADELTRLFRDKKVVSNKVKLQGKTSEVCGRYVVLFIYLFSLGYTMKRVQTLLKKAKAKTGLSYDEIVIRLIKI